MLSEEEKRRLLKTLEEDKEFRYAVAGLLGIREILERLKEHDEKFNAIIARIEKIEERLEEHDKKFNAILERIEKIESRIEKIERRLDKVERRLEEMSRVLGAIGARWGMLSENAFRKAMRKIVQDMLKAGRVEKWTHYDAEGYVYGRPSVVDIDLVVRNGEHILVEIKSSLSSGDILEFVRIAQLYERVTGVKPRLMAVSPFIEEKARKLAEEYGIELNEGYGE